MSMATTTLYLARKNQGFKFTRLNHSRQQLRVEVTNGFARFVDFLRIKGNLSQGTSSDPKLFFSNLPNFTAFHKFLVGRLNWLATGFFHEFIIRGIGYRYKFHRRQGLSALFFKIGYGHRILFPIPMEIDFRNNKRYDFIVAGFNKSVVKTFAEEVRNLKPTDAYKGKGIKYYQTPLKLKIGKVR